jgi:hypothetical protein
MTFGSMVMLVSIHNRFVVLFMALESTVEVLRYRLRGRELVDREMGHRERETFICELFV